MAEHAAIAAGLAPVEGKEVFAIFNGYAQPLEEGQEAILQPGDTVKIVRLENEANIIVVKVDDDGNEVMNGDQPIAENLFPEELTPAEMGEDDAAAEETTDAPAETDEQFEMSDEERAAQTARPKADEPAPAAEAAPAKPSRRKAKPKAEEPAPAKEEPAATEPAAAPEKKGRIRKAAAPAADPAPAAAEKPKEKAAEKTAVTPTPTPQLKDMASVTDAISTNGGDALRAAKALVDRAEQTDFTLGGVLRAIHETGVFKTLGHDGKRGFDDYVELTLGIASRKARYLMSIYTKFALLGIDEAKLNEIGWSKAKELARIPDADLKKDFTKLAKMAGEKSRDELTAHIKTKYEVVTRGEQVQLKAFSFRLAEAEGHTVEEGLKEACTAIGEQDNNKALAHIVGEWRGHAASSDLSLDDLLEMALAKFGLRKISFVDADGNEFELEPEAAETGTEGTETENATA